MLVVGASATGVQLAEEIRRSGRDVTLAVGEHVRMPRTYRGRDIFWWTDAAGILDERYDALDDIVRARHLPSPQLIGTPQRRSIDLNSLRDLGVGIVGRLGRLRDGVAQFSGSLPNTCALADLKMNRLLSTLDEWATHAGIDDEVERPERFEPTRIPSPQTEIDLQRAGIRSVIWATGYRPDHRWIDLPVFDHKGAIRHDGGIVGGAPGMYVVGLNVLPPPWVELHRRRRPRHRRAGSAPAPPPRCHAPIACIPQRGVVSRLARAPCAFPGHPCSAGSPARTCRRSSSWRHRRGTASRGSPDGRPALTSCASAAGWARSVSVAGATRPCCSMTPTCSVPLELAEVAERIEDAAGGTRLIIAGRVLADILHEAAHLVDGLIVDADALAIDVEEVAAELPGGSMTLARRIVEAADGSVRVIATSLDQHRRDASTDPIALASRMVRVASEAVLQHLTPREHAVVALLARTPGIDPHLLDKLAGDGFVGRAVAAGVPLRRQVTGALDVASASAFRAAPIDAETAGALAAELLERGRALEAVGLLLDAGDVDHATAMVLTLSESITDTVEPRQMLSLLARLGHVAEREPALLLLRGIGDPLARTRRRSGRRHRPGGHDGQVLGTAAAAPGEHRVGSCPARRGPARGSRADRRADVARAR